jgi:hypothetical protein
VLPTPGRDSSISKLINSGTLTLADRNLGLVCSGGDIGPMGTAADATPDAGGEAYGSISDALLEHEIAYEGFSDPGPSTRCTNANDAWSISPTGSPHSYLALCFRKPRADSLIRYRG